MANIIKSIFQRTTTALKITEPMKMSLVVRADLKMSSGKTGAQCAHAAIMCYAQASKRSPAILNAWLNLGQPKIVLRVNSMAAIESLAKSANKQNVITSLVRDAGRTEVTAGTVTVLGIGPDTVTNIDALTKGLRLL